MQQKTLPNSTAALVLGILSIVTCICYGIIGLPLGIVAVILGQKALNTYKKNPEAFPKGKSNAEGGKITGIIGVVLNLCYLIFVVYLFYKIGIDFDDPEGSRQRLQEFMEQIK